jgi:hypothetical protein
MGRMQANQGEHNMKHNRPAGAADRKRATGRGVPPGSTTVTMTKGGAERPQAGGSQGQVPTYSNTIAGEGVVEQGQGQDPVHDAAHRCRRRTAGVEAAPAREEEQASRSPPEVGGGAVAGRGHRRVAAAETNPPRPLWSATRKSRPSKRQGGGALTTGDHRGRPKAGARQVREVAVTTLAASGGPRSRARVRGGPWRQRRGAKRSTPSGPPSPGSRAKRPHQPDRRTADPQPHPEGKVAAEGAATTASHGPRSEGGRRTTRRGDCRCFRPATYQGEYPW